MKLFQFLVQDHSVGVFNASLALDLWSVAPGDTGTLITVRPGHHFMSREAIAFISPAEDIGCRKIWLRLSKINLPLD